MSDSLPEQVQQESLNGNKSSVVDVEDSLFISDIEEEQENINKVQNEKEDQYEEDGFVINEEGSQDVGNKRKHSSYSSITEVEIRNGGNKRFKYNSVEIDAFSQGFFQINDESGYLTINSVGSVYYYKHENTTSLAVEFFNNFANSNYQFEFNDVQYDLCFLSNSKLILANSSTGNVLLRDHGVVVNETTNFKLSLFDKDFISCITMNDENKNSSHKLYIATGFGTLFILDKFGNIFKKLLVPSITQMFLSGDKLFVIHNNTKYSLILHSFKKNGDETSYLRYIQRELDLPNEILQNKIINLGISELGTPWVSTTDNFYKLINSFNSNRAYWVNGLNYSNELERLNGGHLTETKNYQQILETIWPIALKSVLDDSIIGIVTNNNRQLSYPLQTIKNFKTNSTIVSMENLEILHKKQEQKILQGEDNDEDDNYTKCELNDENELSLPKYYSHIDNLLQADIARDVLNTASLESYYITDEKELLLKLKNSWDVAILRLFDIKCQSKDIDASYNLVLSLKQDKCLLKASEIAKMYGLIELSDKINELIDSRNED
ncbi:hypothetical protein ACO0SA_004730 [Hanseniaspora valbyensis]